MAVMNCNGTSAAADEISQVHRKTSRPTSMHTEKHSRDKKTRVDTYHRGTQTKNHDRAEFLHFIPIHNYFLRMYALLSDWQPCASSTGAHVDC